jgi:hypothetical protein
VPGPARSGRRRPSIYRIMAMVWAKIRYLHAAGIRRTQVARPRSACEPASDAKTELRDADNVLI